MLIEIRKTDDITGYRLLIDSKEVKNSFFLPSGTIEITNIDISQKIIKLSALDLLKYFGNVCVLENLHLSLIKFDSKVNVDLKLSFSHDEKHYDIELTVRPDYERWDNPFLVVEYMSAFDEEVKHNDVLSNLKYYQFFKMEGFPSFVTREKYLSFNYTYKIEDKEIIGIIGGFLDSFKQIDEKIYEFLRRNKSLKSINTAFSFSQEIKIPCEQYLLYFAQFLQDLGINATSDLKEEAGKVLFSVTPTDDVEALDKIREALAIYLSLPSNPIPNSTGDIQVDMVLSGARANIKHLESQLELAITKLQFKEATLELKDATIEQHQLTTRQKDETIKELKEIIANKNIFQESLERVEVDGEIIDEKSLYRFSQEGEIEIEAKPVLDKQNDETKVGLVKFHEVTKLKDYGVSFDLPKAVRDLINYFKRDKN